MSYRILQINQLLKKEIAENLKTRIPENFGLVTVVDVIITSDLKIAKIYISVLEKENEKRVINFLEKEKFEIRREISPRLKFKFIPKLYFKIDNIGEKITKIDEIFNKLDKENISKNDCTN